MEQRTSVRKRIPPSCSSCKARKIKCDRANPCAHCVRSGAVCVTQNVSGAPRGRNGGRRRKADVELLERITKLEGIVKHFGVESNGELAEATSQNQASKDPEPRLPISKSAEKVPKEGLNRYIGGSLFEDLSEEIHGLREVLDQSSEDEEEAGGPSPEPTFSDSAAFVVSSSNRRAIRSPTRVETLTLYRYFISNVHPVVRILHGPSVHRYLIEQSEQLDCSPGPKGWEALKFAIFFTTVTSLSPEECLQELREEKAVLVLRFREGTESALAKIDFVNTEDLSTLQALVLYLYAIRSNDKSRRTWTLTALAVRIAQALGLNREYQSGLSPFDKEMRRRLWWEICTLDRNSSVDRGSDPIITPSLFNTKLPLHVNDTDLVSDSPEEVRPRDGFTDMTLQLKVHELFDLERHLNYVPAGLLDSTPQQTEDPWAQRRNWVIEAQHRASDKYLRHYDMTVPLQRFTKLVVDIILAQLMLMIYRPLQKHPDDSRLVDIPPAGILHLAVDVLEKGMLIEQDYSSRPFRWISTIWVQWHALAVMIAELCVQAEGPMVQRAWAIQSIVYEEMARQVADSNKGRLWRPIKKMMNKALEVRQNYLNSVGTMIPDPLLHTTRSPQPIFRNDQAPPFQQLDQNSVNIAPDSMPQFSTFGISPQLPQLDPMTIPEPAPLDWAPWITYPVTPGKRLQQQGTELNQMAWTNWKAFISDYQDNEDHLDGQGLDTTQFSSTLGE